MIYNTCRFFFTMQLELNFTFNLFKKQKCIYKLPGK